MLYGTDIVTISIGANNVLLPTIDMIAQYSALSTVTDDSLRDVSLFFAAYKLYFKNRQRYRQLQRWLTENYHIDSEVFLTQKS